MRTAIGAVALASFFVWSAGVAQAQTAPKPGKTYVVGYSQIVAHPALDATRQGFLDGLKAAGFVEGTNLKFEYQNAQGNVGNARNIAQQFIDEKVDLLAPCTTPVVQATVKLARGGPIPVTYGCVNDPAAAGISGFLDKPDGTNVTGLYNLPPAVEIIDLIAEMLPNARTIGTVFNGGESNSVTTEARAEAEAERKGLKWVEVQVASSAEVKSATDSLAGRVDAIFTPQDNTVASAYDAVVKSARDSKLPLFSTDTTAVDRGAIASFGVDQHGEGVAWAKYVAVPVLEGGDPAKMAPYDYKEFDLLLSKTAADAAGVTIPAAVLARAKSVK